MQKDTHPFPKPSRTDHARLLACLLGGASILASLPSRGADLAPLWTVGQEDGSNAEFALAPDGYARFQQAPFFVVGVSDSRQDWPYAQPGPADAWAGQRQHTFSIRFGLTAMPADGRCRLELRLLDTHAGGPPRIRVDVNGHATEHSLPRGGGDASIQGHPEQGRRTALDVGFPASQLQAGDNDIQITTLSGSWLLYDAIALFTPEGAKTAPVMGRTAVLRAGAVRALRRGEEGRLTQPFKVVLRHLGEPAVGSLALEGGASQEIRLERGDQEFTLELPGVQEATSRRLTLRVGGEVIARREVLQQPVRHLTIYVLPHSHTDIGYTELQTAIEEKQVNNLLRGIEIAEATADYPEGARFVWNVEVLWAADLYLRRLGPDQRQRFLDAVRSGAVALNGLYLNELTGLCRPEELLRLCRLATQLGEETGVPVDSAMISDVPGYTWGTVTAMAQAGIRYFSVAPNYFDRIGDILAQWENQPFYWVGPSGRDQVLVWIPWRGYAMSHIIHRLTRDFVTEYQEQLEVSDFPYDIACMRWAGHGDNAVPDPAICDFIRDWNTEYAWPRFRISSTSTAFRAFEERYGDQLPRVAGDWTPYWEDGAGSSALETALNRASSDRLAQAETLWALRAPDTYPTDDFATAWRDTLLYSEHTWGAWCSVSEPGRQETLDQWAIKHSYAAVADRESRALLDRAGAPLPGPSAGPGIDLYNTTSWPRTELVTVPHDFWEGRTRVLDDAGEPVASQRLANGSLVMLADDVPPFAARRYFFAAGQPHVTGRAEAIASEALLRNDRLTVRLDPQTGAIVELRVAGYERNLVDTSDGEGLGDYRYLMGDDLADLQRNGPVRIRVKEGGPLVASLLVESEAPGCRQLVREVRLVAGQQYVELFNLVDKERLVASSYHADEGKESVNFAFPFAVPDGVLRLGLPLAVMRPDQDQLPSGCKNWFTVGRWADVSNDRFGVTWATLDAPLVEVGGITARLLNSQTDPAVWRQEVEPTQRFYSWAMNNHWGTNYRAYQEGPVMFRYVLRPHGGFDAAETARFGLAWGQPLLPLRARGAAPSGTPRLAVTSADVIVTGLKPADDGGGWIIRLWAAGERDATTSLRWNGGQSADVWLSDLTERRLRPADSEIVVPGMGLVTLRVEFPAVIASR